MASVHIGVKPWRRNMNASATDWLAVHVRRRQRPGTVQDGRQLAGRVGPYVHDNEDRGW
jgi:hypothetical protein